MDSEPLNGGLSGQVPTVGSRILPPAPGLLDLIGRNHNLVSAIADLVDNSIDARATAVVIRILCAESRLVALLVLDDGVGMDDPIIDQAMTIGATRSYEAGSLGHFGIGLKAASLGQANSVTVLSRRAGRDAVGRRLSSRHNEHFECDVVDPAYATEALDRDWRRIAIDHGTVVRWDGVRAFPATDDPAVTSSWIDETVAALRDHLGLVFHRLIAAQRVKISVDVEDLASSELGLQFTVDPIDPFGYLTSGIPSTRERCSWRSAVVECRFDATSGPDAPRRCSFVYQGFEHPITASTSTEVTASSTPGGGTERFLTGMNVSSHVQSSTSMRSSTSSR